MTQPWRERRTMTKLSRAQLCGSNFAYQHHRFTTCLDDMQSLDLLSIELWGVAPHCDLAAMAPAEIAVLARAIRARGMRVHCLTPEQVVYPVNIASGDSGLRTRSIDLFKRAAEICHEIGSPYLFLTPGRGYEDEPREEGWKRSAEALSLISRHAQALGVTCLFECLQRNESNLVTNLAQMRQMAQEMDVSNVRMVLDTVAMAVAGDTIDDYFAAFPGMIAHVHLVDGRPGGHLAWGDGQLPLGDYVAALSRHKYDGRITFEIFGDGSYARHPRAALEQCLAAFDACTG